MIWVLLAVVAAALVVSGEVHGRRVAYRRRENVLHGLVVQLEGAAGRWSARRAAERVFRLAQMPARAVVLGPEVSLEEIGETDADRAFVPRRGCCADCDDALDAVAAAGQVAS